MKFKPLISKNIYNLHKGKTVLDRKGRECVICGYIRINYEIYKTYILVAYFNSVIGWKTSSEPDESYYINEEYSKGAQGFLFEDFNQITIL